MIETRTIDCGGLDAEPLERDPFRLGDLLPTQAFAPRDAAAVAALLVRCERIGAAVVFFGAGTLQTIGNAPERYDVAISLARMDRVAAYEPRDLTIGIEAGMTVGALRRRLAADRLFIPIDVPHPARSTVGGALAAGWLGPRRSTYGRPRDLTIGSSVALLDGTIVKSGGMVVKNVTGYDMSKLYLGSLGTLGAIVRLNFKTLPLPERVRVAIAPLTHETRDRAIEALTALPVEPVCALAIAGFASATPGIGGNTRLFIRFEGTAPGIERATRDLRSALGAAGVASTTIVDERADDALDALLDATIETAGAASITYRSNGLPDTATTRAADCTRSGDAYGIATETIADLRTGDVFVRCSSASRDAFLAALPDADQALRAGLGTTAVIAGDAAARGTIDAWGPPPASFAVMRDIKMRFDPRATLAPGRYVGGL